MSSTAKMPERVTSKPSKAPLYAEALRLYLSSPDAPDLVQIATQIGLRPDTLIQLADRQGWSKRRSVVSRDQTAARIAAQEKTEEKIILSTVTHVERYLTELRSTIDKIFFIDTTYLPKLDGETDYVAINKNFSILERRTKLMREANACYREVVQVASETGLIKNSLSDDPKGAKLDLAKLTQLNVTLNAIVQGHEKTAEGSAVIELEPESADEDVI